MKITIEGPPAGTAAGVLSCKLAPSIGLIIGSRQRMACRFTPNGPYPPEAYLGVMNSIGLDIGITAGGAMAWGVITPNAGVRSRIEGWKSDLTRWLIVRCAGSPK